MYPHQPAPPAPIYFDPSPLLPTLPPGHELDTYHNWKLADWVESQKLMPMTAVADSPGARDSVVVRDRERGRWRDTVTQQVWNPLLYGILAFWALETLAGFLRKSNPRHKPQAPPALIRTRSVPVSLVHHDVDQVRSHFCAPRA